MVASPAPSLDTEVRLAILRTFLHGRPTPTVSSIAADLRAAAPDVADAFDRLAAGRVLLLAPGARDILMSAPFAGRPTDFTVTIGSRTHHANCVWDALGVVAMLEGAGERVDAQLRTTCADCGATLTVAVRDGRASAGAGAPVAHFAVRAARWWDDLPFT